MPLVWAESIFYFSLNSAQTQIAKLKLGMKNYLELYNFDQL